MAIPLFIFIKLDSISALARTGKPFKLASTISGFSISIALETTTISASFKLEALCPRNTLMPINSNLFITSVLEISDPEILYPKL